MTAIRKAMATVEDTPSHGIVPDEIKEAVRHSLVKYLGSEETNEEHPQCDSGLDGFREGW